MAKIHGPRIRAARAYAGHSAGKLASLLGVSESTVKRWEAGDPSLTPGYRLAIASVCEVPPQFMENGWGVVLEPGEIERLLRRQDEVLERIEQAITASETARDELNQEGQAWAERVVALARQEFARAPETREAAPDTHVASE